MIIVNANLNREEGNTEIGAFAQNTDLNNLLPL